MGHYASEMDGSPGPNHRPKPSSAWKTMEDAPKNGTRILLWVPKTNVGMVIGKWGKRWVTHTQQVEGWYLDGFDLPFHEEPYLPVLWQDLPARP